MSPHLKSLHLLRRLQQSSLLAAFSLVAAPLFAQHEINDEAERGPVNISINENAFGYSQMSQMAIMQKLQGANRYPREEAMALQQALAAREGLPANHIIQTDGSGPVLLMTAMAYAEPGKNVVSSTPGYTQLTDSFVQQGGEFKSVPLNSKLEVDLKAIKAAMDENTAIVYICNPNNPTGTVPNPIELSQFILSAPKDVLIFIDEAYLELAPGGLEKHSMAKLVKQRENLIVSRTFSKAWGLAGLRIGYGIAQPQVLEKLEPYHMQYPSILSAVAAVAAIEDQDHFAYNVEQYHKVRDEFKAKLDAWGLKYAEPNGSFIFVHTGVPIEELQADMAAEQVLIGRPFPPLMDWARISIGSEEEMAVFYEVFEKVMKQKGKIST
ncbi:MAG: aminotransferase class I/II-fold pyridoxal phosphate-dependent enzyme [Verrucomicrobiota bacterium JB022]|nr:aminotransferase class I/II-fold pyridoxal phosphate-dependent enzyme [Verrucomicrobiota bacterium JB022]